MIPRDALGVKLDMAGQLDIPVMRSYFSQWLVQDPAARYAFPAGSTGDSMASDVANILEVSENWYVGAEVAQVVRALAPEMPPEVLHAEDLPSTHGFLLFQEPQLFGDLGVASHTPAPPMRGLLWATRQVGREDYNQASGAGICIWGLVDVSDRTVVEESVGKSWAPFIRPLVDRGVRCLPASIFAVPFGHHALDLVDEPGNLIISDSADLGISPEGGGVWTVRLPREATGAAISSDEHARIARRAMRGKPTQVRPEPLVQFLQCLWRFQSQEILTSEREWLRKTTARQLVQMKLTPNPVSIIQLRRRAARDSGETGREYHLSHRFVVRGHWRRQWYPSEGRHKSIRIQPFIKGPQGAPLLHRERVNAVVR